jgi:cytochrome c-type biogenesis protein CcmH/NrfG
MRTISRYTISLFIMAIALVVAQAQGINTLQGRVILPDGTQPKAPVRVTLTYSGRRVYETFTDLSGRYSFSGIGKGTYQVTAAGDGQSFEDTSVSAEISVFGGSPQHFSQDIQLRPIQGKTTARAAVVNAFSQDVPKGAREKFERARQLASEGKNEPAMVQLQEAVKIFPQFFDAHLMIGNQLIQAGRLDEAIPPLDRAREIDPNDPRVYQSFGLLMMKQRKYPIAVAIFEEAARLNPLDAMNPLMRASALVYQASYLEPEKSFERKGLLTQAEAAIAKASELSEGKLKPDALMMALFYELKGTPLKAAEELEDYLKRNPTAKNAEAIKSEIVRLKASH